MEQKLLRASVKGDLKEVIRLVENGVDIHAYNDYPLIYASKNGRLKIVKYLIKKGANIHAEHEEALYLSCMNGRFHILKYLVENGANIHYCNDIALQSVCMKGYLDMVKYLVKNGANIHANPCYYEDLDVVHYLLLKGVNPLGVTKICVIKYYSPTTPENVLRLYNLHTHKVDITKLKGLTAEDISSLVEKFTLIHKNLLAITLKGPESIIASYLE